MMSLFAYIHVKKVRGFAFPILAMFSLSGLVAKAQDIHASQYYTTPLAINPAFSGFPEQGDYRLSTNYKQQWSNIGYPYKTSLASGDVKLFKANADKNFLGTGVTFINDVAGASRITETQALLSIAYHLKVNTNHRLSAAIQGEAVQRGINISGLSWDKQFNGDQYDPTLPSGQTGMANHFWHADLGCGILWTAVHSEIFKSQVGISIHHMNRSPQSFITNNTDRLYANVVLHWQSEIKTKNNNTDILPYLLFMKQGPYMEMNTGISLRYNLGLNSKYTGIHVSSAISFGIFYRWYDAIILTSLFTWKKMCSIGLSYDFNTSALRTATAHRGGLEFSLIFCGVFSGK